MIKIPQKSNVPTEKVMSFMQANKTRDQIVDSLMKEGYNSQQISDAFTQAQIKDHVENPNEPYSDPSLQLMDIPEPSQEEPQQDFGIADFGGQEQQQWSPDFGRTPEYAPTQLPGRDLQEQIEEITEAIIEEKFDELKKDLGDFNIFKETIQTEIEAIKQEVMRMEDRVERMQQGILGKVNEYQRTLSDVNTEMQALGKVFEKILEPLTTNIKELSRITEDLKEARKD